MVDFVRSRMTVPTGKASRLRRKSTKSFPASAKTTLLRFASIRSFKLILEVDIATKLALGFLLILEVDMRSYDHQYPYIEEMIQSVGFTAWGREIVEEQVCTMQASFGFPMIESIIKFMHASHCWIIGFPTIRY
jgi:hypothetical protein